MSYGLSIIKVVMYIGDVLNFARIMQIKSRVVNPVAVLLYGGRRVTRFDTTKNLRIVHSTSDRLFTLW